MSLSFNKLIWTFRNLYVILQRLQELFKFYFKRAAASLTLQPLRCLTWSGCLNLCMLRPWFSICPFPSKCWKSFFSWTEELKRRPNPSKLCSALFLSAQCHKHERWHCLFGAQEQDGSVTGLTVVETSTRGLLRTHRVAGAPRNDEKPWLLWNPSWAVQHHHCPQGTQEAPYFVLCLFLQGLRAEHKLSALNAGWDQGILLPEQLRAWGHLGLPTLAITLLELCRRLCPMHLFQITLIHFPTLF